MICVTSANGTTGSAVLAQLRAVQAPLRAAFFSPERTEAARKQGIEAVTIDYRRPETLRAAFQGCEQLFLLGPNLIEQTELELNAVEAARLAGVRHIVKQSVMGAEDPSFRLGMVHRPVERAIETGGMTRTFLRPNSFMQNVLTFMAPSIQHESAFYSATAGAKINHVDVRDIAAVAVKALTEPQYSGAIYTLSGPEALSYDEMADELSRAVGHAIRHVDLPVEDLRQGMLASGMPEPLAERLLDLERYFREGLGAIVSDDIERVTGRAARRFADYALEVAPLLRSA